MIARHRRVSRHPSVVPAAGLILVAVSLFPSPAQGFAIRTTGWGEAEDAYPDQEAAAQEGLQARPGSIPRWRPEQEIVRVAGGADDKIERDTLAVSDKGWDWLERTGEFGHAAMTISRRYGSALENGFRLGVPVGEIDETWDGSRTIGEKVIASTIAIPLIDKYFDNQWKEREAQFRLNVSGMRTLGEPTRWQKEAVSNRPAVDLTMRRWEKSKERDSASANDESPDRGWGKIGGRPEPRDPWAPDARRLRAEGSNAAATFSRASPDDDDREDNSGYQAALKALQGEGGSSDFPDPDDGAATESRTGNGKILNRRTAEAGAVRTLPASTGAPDDTTYIAALREVDADDGMVQGAPPENYTATLAALEKLEADRRAAELAREAERRAAQARREREEKRARERAARQRAEEERQRAARQAREVSRSYSSSPPSSYSYSSRSSGGSRSTGLFGSGSSRSGGLFSAESGRQALRDIEARRRAQERQRAERLRRQQEEFRRRQEEVRRQQEMQRQRREAADRRQRQAEARKQREELQRRQEEARRQREAREREIAEARKRQMALRQQQIEAKRRQEEQRRRQEKARRRAAANAATAAHCLQSRRLKGGFNVADVQIRNTCGFSINVKGACMGTSFKANYPHKGTYSPYESMGLYTLHPGRWRPAVSEDMCNKKGRTARNIACRKPFTPHFTSPNGRSYACFE